MAMRSHDKKSDERSNKKFVERYMQRLSVNNCKKMSKGIFKRSHVDPDL